jgi:hypothetical protein
MRDILFLRGNYFQRGKYFSWGEFLLTGGISFETWDKGYSFHWWDILFRRKKGGDRHKCRTSFTECADASSPGKNVRAFICHQATCEETYHI